MKGLYAALPKDNISTDMRVKNIEGKVNSPLNKKMVRVSNGDIGEQSKGRRKNNVEE